jgi:DNA-binding CsgD family transcriptional regulator
MAEHPTYLPYVGMLDLLPFPAALIDPGGQFVYRNEAHRHHPLWREDAALGKPTSSIPSTQLKHQLQKTCAEVGQQGRARFHLETIRDASNTARRYRWLCLPLLDERGAAEHLLIIELDEEDTPAGLSDRELEVFEHIGDGQTTQEIAETMGISPKTVESYRARIKEKLDLAHNAELVRRAIRWMEGDRAEPREDIFLGELAQEIRSPLAAITGLADALTQCTDREQAHLADLILRSTQQLIRHLDVKLKQAQRHTLPPNGHR